MTALNKIDRNSPIYYMKNEKKLLDWQKQGFITEEQKNKILEYENSKISYNWILYGFMLLGAIIIGIGIISLVAVNWSSIPVWVKLASMFAGLITLGSSICYLYNKPKYKILFEILIIVFLISCLAGIGQLLQIYHTVGKWYTPYLLWSAMTIPIIFYSKKLLAYILWVSLFVTGMLGLTETFTNNFSALYLLFICLFCGILFLGLKKSQSFLLSKAFKLWFLLLLIVSLIIINFSYYSRAETLSHHSLFAINFLANLIFSFLIFQDKQYYKTSKILLTSSFWIILLMSYPGLFSVLNIQWTIPFFIILVLIFYAIHFAVSKEQKLFNIMTFILGLRFLFAYFAAVGGLALTGIGLIISGLAIMLSTYAWYKFKEPLRLWIRSKFV